MYIFLGTFLGFLYENHHDLSQQGTYICTLIIRGKETTEFMRKLLMFHFKKIPYWDLIIACEISPCDQLQHENFALEQCKTQYFKLILKLSLFIFFFDKICISYKNLWFGGTCHSFYLFCLFHTFIITFIQYVPSFISIRRGFSPFLF